MIIDILISKARKARPGVDVWPPHNLFCTCRKCVKSHSGYVRELKKVMRED